MCVCVCVCVYIYIYICPWLMVPLAFKVTTTQSLSQSKVNIHKFWVLRHEHFCKDIFLPTIVYILELKHSHAKENHPIVTSPKVSTNYSINLSPKISFTFYQVKSPRCHRLNQVWVRLWISSILGQNSTLSMGLWNTSCMLPKCSGGIGIR